MQQPTCTHESRKTIPQSWKKTDLRLGRVHGLRFGHFGTSSNSGWSTQRLLRCMFALPVDQDVGLAWSERVGQVGRSHSRAVVEVAPLLVPEMGEGLEWDKNVEKCKICKFFLKHVLKLYWILKQRTEQMGVFNFFSRITLQAKKNWKLVLKIGKMHIEGKLEYVKFA